MCDVGIVICTFWRKQASGLSQGGGRALRMGCELAAEGYCSDAVPGLPLSRPDDDALRSDLQFGVCCGLLCCGLLLCCATKGPPQGNERCTE